MKGTLFVHDPHYVVRAFCLVAKTAKDQLNDPVCETLIVDILDVFRKGF